jgi:hypothetical protein
VRAKIKTVRTADFGRFFNLNIMETSKKDEVLAFIREHPRCTSTAIADELYGKWRWSGWIFVRRDTEALFEEGLIDRREFRGIKTYYPVE